MMKRYSIFVIWALLAVACGGGGDDEEPIMSNEIINVQPNLSLLGDGQEADLKINANCGWTISQSAGTEWLNVNPMSGDNTVTVKVSAGKNSTGTQRIATLTIRGKDITRSVVVTQEKSSDSQTPSSSGEPGAGDNLPPS